MNEESALKVEGDISVIVSAKGPNNETATIMKEKSYNSVILKLEGVIAVNILAWEGSNAVCEIRLTEALLDDITKKWAATKKKK